jgi:hypothetical protein
LNNPVNWVDTDGLQPANVAVPPRVTVRNTPNSGAITQEILESLRHNRTYRISPEQEFFNRARRNANEDFLRQRFPGHQPGQTYLTAPSQSQPCPPRQSPPPNQGRARPHGDETHNQMIDEYIRSLPPEAYNVRKNQVQTDFSGFRVITVRTFNST